jgi:hypothetical protein
MILREANMNRNDWFVIVGAVIITILGPFILGAIVPDPVELKSNIVDLVALGIAIMSLAATILIAWLVSKWDRRAAENTLLWEVAGQHWRSAIALFDNNYGSGTDARAEIKKRREMIERTVRQIKVLDGDNSELAAAFKAVADIKDWDNAPQPEESRIALRRLTIEMTKKFGSKTAQRNAERS